jgi:UDP-3-O-acyl-N-acetylglucosamine deacetylase
MATAEMGATLRETVYFEGVGLHTGEICRIAVHPVSDRRTPCAITIRKGAQRFPARWDYVVDTTRATVLGNGATCISTVEHLMAALWITGITHCEIELLQGNEIPILDGSALPFVEALEGVKAGDPPSPRPSPPLLRGEKEMGSALTPSPPPTEWERGQPISPSPALRERGTKGVRASLLASSLSLTKGERGADALTPSPPPTAWERGACFPLSRLAGEGDKGGEGTFFQARQADRYLGLAFGGDALFGYIDFPAPLGVQAGAFPLAAAAEQIAPARTFGFLREVEALRQQGLALGGALENALVIDETGYHNPARFEDEPLRHKLLDVLGDLYLCGARLTGFTLVAIKPGHALNVQLARQVAQALFTED